MERPTIQSEQLEQHLTFYTPTHQAIAVDLAKVTLSIQDQEYTECRMRLIVSSEVYSTLEAEGGFHLQPEVRLQPSHEAFKTDQTLEIEVFLSTPLLPHLTGYMQREDGDLASIEQLGDVFIRLSQTTPEDALLSTESWYGLAVWQDTQLPMELGGGSVKQGYVTQWATTQFNSETQSVLPTLNHQIYPLMLAFLTQEGIPFQEMEDYLIVRIPIHGENGFWDCFVEAREQDRQCLIYSVYRERVPQYKRLAMAEFITRANYGLPMGCFEMQFDEGEIRCRTSVNVESERFSIGLLRPLFYGNNAVMDRYFQGITKVIKGKANAKQAITMIEEADRSFSTPELT